MDSPALAAIKDYALTEAQYVQAKEAFTAAKKALLSLVPHEIGEFELKEGKFHVVIKYPEKLAWNSEQIENLYGAICPDFVKATYSITPTELRKLPTAEQQTLKGCYELKPGSPSIDVEVI